MLIFLLLHSISYIRLVRERETGECTTVTLGVYWLSLLVDAQAPMHAEQRETRISWTKSSRLERAAGRHRRWRCREIGKRTLAPEQYLQGVWLPKRTLASCVLAFPHHISTPVLHHSRSWLHLLLVCRLSRRILSPHFPNSCCTCYPAQPWEALLQTFEKMPLFFRSSAESVHLSPNRHLLT